MNLGRDIVNDSGIVAGNMTTMPLRRRVIIGHVVIGHVNVQQVLWLGLRGNVFNGWGNILSSLVWMTITSSIH